MIESALVWFRRDLRLSDHAALSLALHSARRVYCVFVFDSDILSALVGVGQTYDRRVEFMLESVRALRVTLRALNGELIILHGKAAMTIPSLASRLSVDAVF
ncbi:partial Cryptochrome-like protein cry2, partial [uncultured bacterium]